MNPKPLHAIICLMALAPGLIAAQDRTDKLAAMPQLTYDSAQTEPIVTFDIDGGFQRAPSADFVREPKLRIYADGRVVLGKTSERIVGGEFQADRADIYELLDNLINRQKILECNTEKIKRAIADATHVPKLMDSATSYFQINTKNSQHKVEVYALKFIGKRIPEVPAIRRALNCHDILNRFAATALIGSDENFKSILDQVNGKIRSSRPDLTRMSQRNLEFAVKQQNGTLSVYFHKTYYGADKKIKARVNVSYRKTKDAPAEIKLSSLDPKSNR